MLDYMNWANDRVLAGAHQLSPEKLTAPLRPGFSSTQELLVHIMAAERAWLSRWQGSSPRALLNAQDIPSLDALAAAWGPLRDEMRAFATSIEDASQTIVYYSTKGEAFHNIWWHLFLHVFNHGTEHRAQVALYLATNGIDLGNLDLSLYLRDLKK
jgi:uncharacterized damage-inducible protein DinB